MVQRRIYASVIVLLGTGCGSKRTADDARPAPPKRDPNAECMTLFDRFHASLAEALGQIGVHETVQAARTRDAAGIAACARLDDPHRSCLLDAPVAPAAWSTCKVDAPFVLFEASAAHDALLGAPVPPAVSDQRIAALAGTWQHPAIGLDDAITWKIGPGSKLAVRRTSKQGKHDDPPHEIAFARERVVAIKTGTSTQFVPLFADGDRIYLSWTSGALPIPMTNEQAFALDLAGGDRWVIWRAPSCKLLDPRLGVAAVTCRFDDNAGEKSFVVEGTEGAQDLRWPLRHGALLHPAMEVFTRQGK